MARGRPTSFDKDKVMIQILNLFRKSGYLGASYTDLCQTTGLTKPSLYAAYGNKEDMFLKALNLYLEQTIQPSLIPLDQNISAPEAIEKVLEATVLSLTQEEAPHGCLIATNAALIHASGFPATITEALQSAAAQTPCAICERLSQAPQDEQPKGIAQEDIVTYFSVVIAGLSSLAGQGFPREDLMQATKVAMRIFD